MEVRYRLIRLKAQTSGPDELLADIVSQARGAAEWLRRAGRSEPWQAVVAHLDGLHTKMLLVQRSVADTDFLEEHRTAYASQHRAVSKWCIRVHAFNATLGQKTTTDEPTDVLRFIDRAHARPGAYIGYVTLRPLRHARVGATVLPPLSGGDVTATDTFKVEIAGHEFRVVATPFLQQDSAAGACAQASMWMALRTIRQRLGRAAVSTAELTLAASRDKRFNRPSPGNDGLTVEQMVEALRATGHHYFHFDVPSANLGKGDDILRTVGPYLDSGLPVVLALRIGLDMGHAVVAVGREIETMPMLAPLDEEERSKCRYAESWLGALIVHNDNQGPYMRLALDDVGPGIPSAGQTKAMIIPLPRAVLMTAKQAQFVACQMGIPILSNTFTINARNGLQLWPAIEVVLRTFLCSRHALRNWVQRADHFGDVAREAYRTISLPELMWVIEIHDAAKFDPVEGAASCCGEILLDAASDALQGDGLIAGRLISDLFPSADTYSEMVAIDDTESLLIADSTGRTGRGMDRPSYA